MLINSCRSGLGKLIYLLMTLLLFAFWCTLGSLPCWMPHLVMAKNQMMSKRRQS
uniref:Uncharacterized protein n=1 Tax=Lotus japonicus TaxID=34305 RepID=I3T3U0_LOTJA|nr:unknown [Lotus japonicus]